MKDLTIDNRTLADMEAYYLARIEALKKRIFDLECGATPIPVWTSPNVMVRTFDGRPYGN